MSQYYKSISFPKIYNDNNETKLLRLALNKNENTFIDIIKDLSSAQIRNLLDNKSYNELESIANIQRRSLSNTCVFLIREKLAKYTINTRDQLDLFFANTDLLELNSSSGTFKNNKNKGIFNWYPYVEGFSYDFVEKIFDHNILHPKSVYDPFAGTGTTILVSTLNKINSGFSEINPFMRFIINTKIDSIKFRDIILQKERQKIYSFCDKIALGYNGRVNLSGNDRILLDNGFFEKSILKKLVSIKNKINDSSLSIHSKNLLTLLLSSIVVKESNMIRRADLRYKKGREFEDIDENIFLIFKEKVMHALSDLEELEIKKIGKTNHVSDNAKEKVENYYEYFDTIITSPPYVNGTNYFRNTKLELLFLDLVNQNNDMRKLRQDAITAGINNVSNKKKLSKTNNDRLNEIIELLEENNYDKRIPRLVEHYFFDMNLVFQNLYNMLEAKGNFYFDIGDSIFNDIHIPTDLVFEDIAENIGFKLVNKTKIRNRFSKNGKQLGQWLIHFTKEKNNNPKFVERKVNVNFKDEDLVSKNWKKFRDELPYRKIPYSKRNWGSKLHSLCSYQGKLKPSIAHFLVKYFTKENTIILDPLAGVGTIPLEALLQKRKIIANDLSKLAYSNTLAKVGIVTPNICLKIINDLERFIKEDIITDEELAQNNFGFNKKLNDYYHPETFKQIISARKYFLNNVVLDENHSFVFSSLLHILHGNRPYALSRTSHPITPFAPKGDFIKKDLIEKLKVKVERALTEKNNWTNNNYKVFLEDYINLGEKIKSESVDIVITSPPFYDSTKFYMANWIRMWFAGWEKNDFKTQKESFLETKQVQDIGVYKSFFNLMSSLLKKDGHIILHLGFSKKANMAEMLIPFAQKHFTILGYFNEKVTDNENFGISDQGSVKVHQYLFLKKK